MTALLLSRFVPYPLMDVPAVLCLAIAVLLLCERRWWTALAGGALLAAAVNLRPAYLLPVVLMLVVVLATRWQRTPFVALGGAAALAVQAVYGRARVGVTSLWPPDTETVTAIQLNYAAYGVRYDTIPFTRRTPGCGTAARAWPRP